MYIADKCGYRYSGKELIHTCTVVHEIRLLVGLYPVGERMGVGLCKA